MVIINNKSYQIVEGDMDKAHINYELIIAAREGTGSNRIQNVTRLCTELTWTTKRIGAPGQLDFQLIKYDGLSFTEGDQVIFRVNDKNIFKGYVFSKDKDDKGVIDVVCYDQLRYLKAKQNYNFTGFSAGGIVAKIANDFLLKTGHIAETKYLMESMLWDNGTMLDAINHALQQTQRGTGITYNFYDNFGELTLTAAKYMKSKYVLGDGSFVTGYNYKTSIDDEVYNYIKLVQPNEATGMGVVYAAKAPDTIKKWGLLQKYETVDDKANPAQVRELAQAQLQHHGIKRRTLRLTCIGVEDIRAGSVVVFEIKDMGDISLLRWLIVDSVKHHFKPQSHTMDLELRVYHELDMNFDVIIDNTEEIVINTGGSGGSGGGEVEQEAAMVAKGNYYKPIHGPYTISFKYRAQYKKGGLHKGVDMVGSHSCKIYACTTGYVYDILRNNKSYGNAVHIMHDDGYSSLYAHLSSISPGLYEGSGCRVDTGTVLGIQGNTGNSTGEHLHFEVRKSPHTYGNDVNPSNYVKL